VRAKLERIKIERDKIIEEKQNASETKSYRPSVNCAHRTAQLHYLSDKMIGLSKRQKDDALTDSDNSGGAA